MDGSAAAQRRINRVQSWGQVIDSAYHAVGVMVSRLRAGRTRLVIAALLSAALACNFPLQQPEDAPATSSSAQQTAGADLSALALVCDQPQMDTVIVGSDRSVQPQDQPTGEPPATQAGPEPTASPRDTQAPSRSTSLPTEVGPLRSVSFLEIPFPYDGGNENFGGTDEQFVQASQMTANGGRINSFFDHLLPLYPSEHDGREPADPPAADRVLRFDGSLSEQVNYSGHPAYDYSTFVPRQPTTPVFAAADGEVSSVGECCGGALIVRLRHEVEGVGAFQTSYMHLHPDEHFEATRALQGQPIAAGTRIGTMGNTGWSTGHHLHFEVRFDADQNDRFRLTEVVDPFGFVPSQEYANDPWADRTGGATQSLYLWRHPFGSQGQVPAAGGGEMRVSSAIGGGAEQATLCAPQGSLPPGGQVTIIASSDPPPAPGMAGTGTSFTVSVTGPEGGPVDSIVPPATIEIPLAPSRLGSLLPETEAVYWYAPAQAKWIPVPARVDRERDAVVVEISRTGRYALLGDPIQDHYRPRTEILVDGPTSPSGTFYDAVTVTLESEDPSGIERIDYSLDNGSTWQEYTGPFELDRSGVPEPLHGEGEPSEVFGGGPGRHLVLASAVDGAGNVEDPPAFRLITIDPREDPDAGESASSGSPPTIKFNADSYSVQAGSCTTLRWRVENADSVSLDGEEVPALEAEEVCPETTTVYQLLAENTAGGETATVTIEITEDEAVDSPPAAPSQLTIANKTCSDAGYSVTLEWVDNASTEEGYRVYRDGSLIATLGANAESYTDNPPGSGPYEYGVEAYNSAGASSRPTVDESGCLF